jgi:anaphase-promoting complex subunit 8
MALNERETSQLRAALQEAVVKCSERCLYQSAKWYEAQSRFELPC